MEGVLSLVEELAKKKDPRTDLTVSNSGTVNTKVLYFLPFSMILYNKIRQTSAATSQLSELEFSGFEDG
ncbi:hypothetical protein SanaruYs_15430 [Chryseotalea sanaruensis]|uniref:Uncharacterized protein n=1 Tax=Chryseotalea sanaruensis TaxID=2482724 RepID=A0A401U8V6_9BACT|nr:hypothetical protein [Chryseotalea sanaruensis]GCC51320.1 hypothetical protein SanaruYs_15430 [Chryseotalea sanaruensis]